MENSRRDFIKKTAVLTLGTLAANSFLNDALAASGLGSAMDGGKYSLPALPYGYDALEPHIDKLTMEIHHSKHHQSYVNNLNKALEEMVQKMLKGAQDFDTLFSNADARKGPTASPPGSFSR